VTYVSESESPHVTVALIFSILTVTLNMPTTAATEDDRPANRARLGAWPTFVILLATVGTMTTNCADPDLWGHYQYGREVLRDGVLPTTTTWSYAVENHPWVNHENLSELATAWAADEFGVWGLTIGKLLLACVMIGSAVWWGRRVGSSWFAIGLVAVLAAVNIQFHWHFRPHAWTYAFFAVMVAILENAFAGWRGESRGWSAFFSRTSVEPPRQDLKSLRQLWWIPPLLCLWTNTHGGFAAGLAIYLAYLGLRAVQGWAWWGGASYGLQKRLVMMMLAGVLATFINPYGPGLHVWMADTLGAAPPEIGDWGPLPLWSTEALGFWLLIGVVAASLLASSRRRDPVHLILMALILWQGVEHCRHICFFAILCAFWIPSHLTSALQPFVDTWKRQLGGRSPAPWVRHALTCGLATGLMVVAAQLGPKLSIIEVDRGEYPVAAMQFLKDHDLRGRTMVTFNWAQYAIACFAHDDSPAPSLVAIDGRLNTCYPRDVLDIYLDFLLGPPQPGTRLRSPDSGPYDPALALEYAEPDLFVLDRGQKPAIRIIESDPRWTLLYQDSIAQIWGRKDRYDVPASEAYFPPEEREIDESPQTGVVNWPAFPVDQPVRIAAR
jgi:hypothetical protein